MDHNVKFNCYSLMTLYAGLNGYIAKLLSQLFIL